MENGFENSEALIESQIENALTSLREFGEWFDELSPDTQEEWYEVEMQAEVAADRNTARMRLEEFVSKVSGEVDVIKNRVGDIDQA